MTQISASSVRPWPLKASDPIAIAVAGVFLIAASSGLVGLIGWSADQVAGIQSGVLMLAAVGRMVLESRNAKRIEAEASALEARAHREALEKPAPRRVSRRGAPGEGGPVALPDDDSFDDEASTNPQG